MKFWIYDIFNSVEDLVVLEGNIDIVGNDSSNFDVWVFNVNSNDIFGSGWSGESSGAWISGYLFVDKIL